MQIRQGLAVPPFMPDVDVDWHHSKQVLPLGAVSSCLLQSPLDWSPRSCSPADWLNSLNEEFSFSSNENIIA
jgi:hypothetical protein